MYLRVHRVHRIPGAGGRRHGSRDSLSSTPDNTQDTTGPHGMTQHTKAAGLHGKAKHKGAAQAHSTRTDDKTNDGTQGPTHDTGERGGAQHRGAANPPPPVSTTNTIKTTRKRRTLTTTNERTTTQRARPVCIERSGTKLLLAHRPLTPAELRLRVQPNRPLGGGGTGHGECTTSPRHK
jgi:hypothetical protein